MSLNTSTVIEIFQLIANNVEITAIDKRIQMSGTKVIFLFVDRFDNLLIFSVCTRWNSGNVKKEWNVSS
jgi:hypothetical protein